MTGWFSEVQTIFVPARELEEVDPALHSFINLNTPEEFEQFKDYRFGASKKQE